MLDEWIETLKRGECIKEHELKKLCAMVSAREPPSCFSTDRELIPW